MADEDLKMEDFGSIVSETGCQIFFARKRGRGHVEKGTVCQDYCLVQNVSDDVLVIAVADGHGGDLYVKSDIGARIACETLVSSVESILKIKLDSLSGDAWVEAVRDKTFKTKYIKMWKDQVLEDYKSNPENKPEAVEGNIIKQYGTTILFAIVTKEYYILGQLGDGAILMFNNDSQGQLFKRHGIKRNSQTSSLASGRAEYAFMINVFRRELFGNILLSTDGIYDRLDKENSFLIYADSLRRHVLNDRDLDNPFEIDGIDVSEISKDDCTVVLMVSDKPTQKYEVKIPEWLGFRNVGFVRAYNGMEIYQAQGVAHTYEIHVSTDAAILEDVDVRSCMIQQHKHFSSKPGNRNMFIYAIPKGAVSLQQLVECGEHLEKRYWFNNKDYVLEEESTDTELYSNQFWLDLYEKLRLVEKEFEIIKVCPVSNMFHTAYITSDRNLLFFSDTLRKEGFKKEKLTKAFRDFYDHFSIIGKLSCGNITIPLFCCASQGQNINMLHSADSDTSLCKVLYNNKMAIHGLYNLSGRIWYIEDEKREIAPQGVLKLDRSRSFTIEYADNKPASGAEFVDRFARYKVELF